MIPVFKHPIRNKMQYGLKKKRVLLILYQMRRVGENEKSELDNIACTDVTFCRIGNAKSGTKHSLELACITSSYYSVVKTVITCHQLRLRPCGCPTYRSACLHRFPGSCDLQHHHRSTYNRFLTG